MSFDRTQWVWHNGEIVPWSGAGVHLSANIVQYGSGVFEGIRCYETDKGPAIFRLEEHVDRLYSSAAKYDIAIPLPASSLKDGVCEAIRRNGFTSCYIRPVCYYGSGRPGICAERCPVNISILVWPWDPFLGDQGQKYGVRVSLSKWVKFHSSMLPTTAKACGGYLNSMLAARDARRRGYDEALLLNAEGNLAEGPTENIFIVHEDRLITNDESSSILLGITRDSVIRIAHDLGYAVEIHQLRLGDLAAASEAFLTGTAAEITPIREFEGRPIGMACPGPVTLKIQRAFLAATSGRLPQYHSWLHFVGSG
jgi:branched-chain amino acid aminotransferase